MGHGSPSPIVFATSLQEIQTGRPPQEGGRQNHWFEKRAHLYVKFTTKGGFRERPFPDYELWKLPARTTSPNVGILNKAKYHPLSVMAVTVFVSYTPVFGL
jgi:hypothetical protein